MGKIREDAEDGDEKGTIGGEKVRKCFESLFSVFRGCREDFRNVRNGLMRIELDEFEQGSGERRMGSAKVEREFVEGCRGE